MINIDNVEKFINEELEKGEHFSLRKEGWIELITRLRSAEKDAARYRFMRDMSDEVDVSRFFYVEIGERDAEIDGAMQCK